MNDHDLSRVPEPFKIIKRHLQMIGMTITQKNGEYRVNYAVGGTEATAYYTNDIQDAIGTAKHMAKQSNPVYKKYGGREGSAEFRHMTLEEAKMLGYGDSIWVLARDGSARRVKVNGAVKRWKREPDRIEVPFKYGLYEYGTFQNRDFGENGDVLVPL
jgi:hypothetical protein